MSAPGALIAAARGLPAAYATVVFAERPAAGLLCLAATCVYPRVALAGLAALLLAEIVLHAADITALARPAARANCLLTGLALAALWPTAGHGWPLFLLALPLALALSLWLGELAWRAGQLPALSLPFTLALWAVLPLAGGTAPAIPALGSPVSADTLPGAALASLGWIFLAPHPLAGALVLAALITASRHLALLALAGFMVGWAVLGALAPEARDPSLAFNPPLAAMAVGGIYCRPGAGSLLLGLAAAALAALAAASLNALLAPLGLMPLSAPFVIAALLSLAAARHARRGIQTMLTEPGLPERHAARARLARARLGEPGSLPLAPPFMGEWQVYQGFDGEHTHKGPWRHALDFFLVEDGRSFRGEGRELADYLCFGLPVLAPLDGVVVAAEGGVPDNPPGHADTRRNWGNHVVIRADGGAHVLLAHLRAGSVAPAVGARVKRGEVIGACGNSGRSPQPHLHLNVQAGPRPGEPTLPFHLDHVLARENDAEPRWHLARVPLRGERVRAATPDAALARALAQPVGRRMSFEVKAGGIVRRPWEVEAVLTPLGEPRLASGRASIAAARGPHAFALYDRQGAADPCLDLMALALGLIPLAEAQAWRDAPPARLFPASRAARLTLWLTRPLGAALDSHYRRRRLGNGAWRHEASHLLSLAPGWRERFDTEADLAPDGRLLRLAGRGAAGKLELTLVALGQNADQGIPAWRAAVATG